MLLTPKQKLVWQMHKDQEIPQVRIAEMLNLRPESVCRLLARAEKRIKPVVDACRAAGGDCSLVKSMLKGAA